MAFDIGTKAREERAKARWVQYETAGGTPVRFFVKPEDPEIVKALDAEFPINERLARGGRQIAKRSPEDARKYGNAYLAKHVTEWDITEDGQPVAPSPELMDRLPDVMRNWLWATIQADDLRELESPFPG